MVQVYWNVTIFIYAIDYFWFWSYCSKNIFLFFRNRKMLVWSPKQEYRKQKRISSANVSKGLDYRGFEKSQLHLTAGYFLILFLLFCSSDESGITVCQTSRLVFLQNQNILISNRRFLVLSPRLSRRNYPFTRIIV